MKTNSDGRCIDYGARWIIPNSFEEIGNYPEGMLTLRGLYYRLVGKGMPNDAAHWYNVRQTMGRLRKQGKLPMDTFVDHERSMMGRTKAEEKYIDEEIDNAKFQIKAWMQSYSLEKWSNQPYYPEVFVEKKTLLNVLSEPCKEYSVALGACKGYPSISFKYETALRFKEQIDEGKKPIVLYFGDYDPTGDDISREFEQFLNDYSGGTVEVRRVALNEQQVIDMALPVAPVKDGDTRAKNWDGLGQVELDSIEPRTLQQMCREAVDEVFDDELNDELQEQEREEREVYQAALKKYVSMMK